MTIRCVSLGEAERLVVTSHPMWVIGHDRKGWYIQEPQPLL